MRKAWKIVTRDVRDTLGEGTLWSARNNALYWVDILAPALNRLSLADGRVQRWPMPEPIGWVVERQSQPGFIAGFKSGFAELTLDPLRIRPIGNPEPELPGNRMNDGKADAQGRIWAGTMDMAEESAVGSLYRLDADRHWVRMDQGYGVTNGPAFSRDGHTLYHTDTLRRTVYRFPLRTDGSLGNREDFIHFTQDQGYPDGMTVDAEDGLWIAHWGGARISRFLSDGRLDREIALPTAQITNVAFAGPKLDRLFASSASRGLEKKDELAGCLFEIESGIRGLPTNLAAL